MFFLLPYAPAIIACLVDRRLSEGSYSKTIVNDRDASTAVSNHLVPDEIAYVVVQSWCHRASGEVGKLRLMLMLSNKAAFKQTTEIACSNVCECKKPNRYLRSFNGKYGSHCTANWRYEIEMKIIVQLVSHP